MEFVLHLTCHAKRHRNRNRLFNYNRRVSSIFLPQLDATITDLVSTGNTWYFIVQTILPRSIKQLQQQLIVSGKLCLLDRGTDVTTFCIFPYPVTVYQAGFGHNNSITFVSSVDSKFINKILKMTVKGKYIVKSISREFGWKCIFEKQRQKRIIDRCDMLSALPRVIHNLGRIYLSLWRWCRTNCCAGRGYSAAL